MTAALLETRARHAADPADGWDGTWAADRLGLDVVTTAAPVGLTLHDLVGMAVRRNPRRAQLLVSRVLGKHLPADPRVVHGAGLLLGELVRATLTGTSDDQRGRGRALRLAIAGRTTGAPLAGLNAPAVPGISVIGFAETATALGQSVSDALGARYLHSTRRHVPGVEPVGRFEEEHSHATTHLLLPADPRMLDTHTLVLVDDELSTGRTARNTIAALHATWPRSRYVVATLVDLRSPQDTADLDAFAADLGVGLEVVALASGTLTAPADVTDRATDALQQAHAPVERAGRGGGLVRRVQPTWPLDLPESARHGWDAHHRRRLDETLPATAAQVASALTRPPHHPARVLVLGTEELMYVPMRLAAALADTLHGTCEVRFSSTTRSPALTVDDPGYAIRSALIFPAHDDPQEGPGPRFAYNVSSYAPDTVVLVVDADADTSALAGPDGLLDQLRASSPDVVVVTLPGTAGVLAGARTQESG